LLRTVQDRTGDLHRFVDSGLFDNRAGDGLDIVVFQVKVRLKAIKAACAAWRTRRSSGVISILALRWSFSRATFHLSAT
jgi:hypothetical protein